MNPHLDFMLSWPSDHPSLALATEHLADLRRSGLTNETIAHQRFLSVPPSMIGHLLGFDVRAIRSAMLIPFPDPAGAFMDHVRMKIFPPLTGRRGHTVKYLQPRGSGVRLFFPLVTLDAVIHSDRPLWLVEGEKKSLAVAQLGLPSVGFCGIDAWHRAGSHDLISDFSFLQLRGRVVELIPDGDVATNPNVRWGARRLADALRATGARPRLVKLPKSA
jgi:hypothetical protein